MFRSSANPPATPGRRMPGVLQGGVLVLLVLLIWHHWDHSDFVDWKNNADPIPFFLALAILPAFGFPTTPFYLVAGATFDLPTALGGSLMALAVTLVLNYFIARGPLRSLIAKWLARSGRELPHLERLGYWRFTLIVKFLPGLPAFLKHSAIALAGVPFPIYFSLSLIISGVYAAGFILLGESALDRDYGRGIFALLVLAAVTVVVVILLRRRMTSGGR